MNHLQKKSLLGLMLVLSIAGLTKAETSTSHLTFTDIKGKQHTPFSTGKHKAVVFVFLLRDCPVSNVYTPELTRIRKDYSKNEVALYLIHPDRDTNAKAALAHAKEYKLTAPVVLDHNHKLTRLAKANVTPEAAVFDAQQRLMYRGRIDNLYADFGKKRFKPSQHDLRDTLDALLAGKPLTKRTTDAIGCYIDFSNDKKKSQ
ncbi:MAG: redoxin domain-containing protein [Verrucomicrobiota bacterium]|nr:redoxin domain-containing protein [Verrucomicrobiota bacterium]MED6315409.1 redoxin domain-containing protein [Verrucomicrobiota bacterium]MEE2941942.1 redoxin domain-containing protein [Verrucomicrobiota bacterium]